MILREAGLIPYWMKKIKPNIDHCLAKTKEKFNSSPETSFKALSLKNLNGAFYILGVGYVAAFFVFIGEQIMFGYLLKDEINEKRRKKYREELKYCW